MNEIFIIIYLVALSIAIIGMSIINIIQNIKINKKMEQERKEIQEWLKNK